MTTLMNTAASASTEALCAFLRAQTSEATIELLGELHDVRCSDSEQRPESEGADIIATIGFSSDLLRGALALVVPDAAAAALLPTDGSIEATTENRCDVVGELSNMLLGRLKIRLLKHGIRILLATPITSRGGTIDLSPPSRGISVWQVFNSSLGFFSVRLDALVDPTLNINAPLVDANVINGGELVLF